MKNTRTNKQRSPRIERAAFERLKAYHNSRSTLSGLGNLADYRTVQDIDNKIAEIESEVASGTMERERADDRIAILRIRRQGLRGESTIPPEGTVKVTNNCVISRIGGNIVISLSEAPDDRLRAACELQGFVFDTNLTCRAPFSTNRYIFALELCQGYEAVEKGLDVDAVTNVIANYMESYKVGFDGLSEEVRNAIESTKKLEWENAPDLPVVDASEVEDIPDYYKIIDDIKLGHNVFLVGPAGSGKTYLAEKICRDIKRQYITLNCSQYTSPGDIKGGPTIDGYVEGALINCWADGKVLILDELPKIDPNTAGLLNEALAKTKVRVGSDRAVIYNGRNEPKQKAEGFGVIATGNVFPTAESASYTANTRQDLSLLDRFSGSVYYVGFNEKIEKKSAGALLVYSVGMRLRQWILENRVDSTISLRWLETAGSVYYQEMARKNGERKDVWALDSGKTLKDHVDAVITTFNRSQQDNLRVYMDYDRVFATHQYRDLPSDNMINWQ